MTLDGYCALGLDREYDLTEEALLRAMDQAGVDRAVIAPVDRCLAVDNREGNDLLLAAAAAHPGRLIPACTASPWCGHRAVQEVRRALDAGARLLVLHPAVQGYLANDELVWPLLEAAAAERVPVYVHTGPPGHATPWQVVDLADHFPELDLIMGHCGATDLWNDVVEAARAAPRVHLESSLARPFQFCRYLDQVGHARGIMGSFAPLNDLGLEWQQMRAVLPAPAQADVCGGNLLRLLERRGPL
ncbi:MAG: amidohydrolase family protein [Candidatus Latescibacterota bacterium]